MRPYVTVEAEVDLRDVISGVWNIEDLAGAIIDNYNSKEEEIIELIELLMEGREDRIPRGETGVFIPTTNLGTLTEAREVLDAAGIPYNLITS